MKVHVQELEPCKRQLVVEAPEGEVAAAWEAAYGRVQREARLPGFRRGKVPRSLVRAHFAGEVRRAVAEQLIPAVYRRALDETRLHPVEDPQVKDLQLEEGQPLRFTAVVEIKPTIALDEYRGLPVTHTSVPAEDADVDAALASLADRHATLVTVARAARAGDHVVVDYTLEPEGAEPRSERGYGFEVGGGRVLPEMDEAVVGLQAGDERQLSVRLPAEHPREELRGKPCRLSLRVVEVKEKEVPALDDDFARALGSHQTVAELRAAVRAELEAQRERQNRRAFEEAAIDAALTRHDFAVPESLVTREIGHRVSRMQAGVSRQGIDPAALDWDYARLAEELRPAAVRAVRWALLQEAIAEREELTVSEAEVEAELARLARDSGRAPQALRSLLERSGELEGLRLKLREEKVLNLLIEHAQIHSER
ncbi:MAG: trigger factor [Candidatus Rokubacteria bacterium]|nr:trigger factor [Candidatus Rokubacteria bacterium]